MDAQKVFDTTARQELPNPFADKAAALRSIEFRTADEDSQLERYSAFNKVFDAKMPAYKAAVGRADWQTASTIAATLLEAAKTV